MAARESNKRHKKEKCKNGEKDDLDLRDEILELKKENLNLRKERDKMLIKFRKSEDDSKRKDKQIEQLMDPSQNSEIRRLLSMKGAALLLNLKDQNNTLMQMLVEKNQQIKRLANEIKIAKLYTKSSKTEPYRLEISRLRHLLLQSQEALKEAATGPHVVSACRSHDSSCSSDDVTHSPQELEELRFMVHSLETHMQYSRDLLSKKNQEISTLSRELDDALGGHCCRKMSNKWKIELDSRKPEYDSARRCTSASKLEPFQFTKPLRHFPEKVHLTKDHTNTYDQMASKILIQHEKNYLESQAETAWQTLKKDDVKRLEESLSATGFCNCDRKKTSIGKEKWEFAVEKVKNLLKKGEKAEKVERKLHTNPSASDNEVWSILESEVRDKSFPIHYTAEKRRSRSASLPSNLFNQNSPKKILDQREKMLTKTEIEEPCEIITKSELTPRDEQSHQKYRPSIDSSIDSENCSRFEMKLFEVEAEINNFASISSRSESPDESKETASDKVKKVEGGNCFQNEFLDNEEEDDDDVITI